MDKIKFKRTSTAGVTPTVSQCDKGELVINSTDRKLFTQDESGNIVELGASFAERYAMPKVQFDAKREMNKAKYAGSGFVEFGKHHEHFSTVEVCGEGLWSVPHKIADYLYLGRDSLKNYSVGVSRSSYAKLNIDGAILDMFAGYDDGVKIKFPNSPDGTKSYDSATGIVTDHLTYLDPKYDNTAALSQSDAVSRCFEGVIYNGDFRLGSEGWTASTGTLNVNDGVASWTNGSAIRYAKFHSPILRLSASTTYELSFYVSELVGQININTNDASGWNFQSVNAVTGNNRVEFTSSTGDLEGQLFFQSLNEELTSVSISSVSIRPVTSAPILTRQDLCFVEVNPNAECTVFKPLGNNQYGDSTADGITLKKLTDLGIPQSVSGFGAWDSETVGYGELISSLTDAQLKTVLSNPKNNIRFDPIQNKLLQSEYKIYVDEGSNDTDTVDERMTKLGYVKDTVDVTRYNHADGRQAIGVCLRQTLNQGAYHPQFNSSGCSRFWGTTTGHVAFWHDANVTNLIKSAKDCFNYHTDGGGGSPTVIGKVCWGNHGGVINNVWGTTVASGRPSSFPDQFYDAVYAHQIFDLRITAHKQDVNKLRVDAMRKAVAGEMRGWGKVPFTTVFDIGLHSSAEYAAGYYFRIMFPKDTIPYRYLTDASSRTGVYADAIVGYLVGKDTGLIFSVQSALPREVDLTRIYLEAVNHEVAVNNEKVGWYFVAGIYKGIPQTTDDATGVPHLTPQNDTLAWTDLVGSPSAISECFPNGVQGMWVSDIREGTFNRPANRKINASGRVSGEYWSGTKWISHDHITDTTNNTIYVTVDSSIPVTLIHYPTLSNFTEPANNSKIVGEVGDVWYGHDNRVNFGNRLLPSLTGLVGNVQAYTTNGYTPSVYYAINPFDGAFLPDETPEHYKTKNMVDGGNAVKALSTITEKDGLLYLQLHGCELKHTTRSITVRNASIAATTITKGQLIRLTGFNNYVVNGLVLNVLLDDTAAWTESYFDHYFVSNNALYDSKQDKFTIADIWEDSAWGDDSTIPIINGEGTKTDLNGNTVKTFCHHTQIPLGIASHSDSSQSS